MLTTVDVREIYARSSAEFAARVHAVDGRWDAPTELPGWTVRTLVRHLVEEERWTPPLFAGSTIAEIGSRFDGDLLGDDPVGSFDAASVAALAAIREEGATERTVHLSFGDRPGHEYAMQLANDHLVHAWDLARALGTDETLDPETVAAIHGWFGPTQELYLEIGVIAQPVEVPADASPQAKLLGMMGRTP